MKTLKNYIFMLCPDCGRMSITKRENYDPKEAVWCKNPCDCTNESTGETYYKEDGEFSVDPFSTPIEEDDIGIGPNSVGEYLVGPDKLDKEDE